MNEELQTVVLRLLERDWESIHYVYENLSSQEKAIVNPEQFRELIIKMYQKDLV